MVWVNRECSNVTPSQKPVFFTAGEVTHHSCACLLRTTCTLPLCTCSCCRRILVVARLHKAVSYFYHTSVYSCRKRYCKQQPKASSKCLLHSLLGSLFLPDSPKLFGHQHTHLCTQTDLSLLLQRYNVKA